MPLVKYGPYKVNYRKNSSPCPNGIHLPLIDYVQWDYHSCGYIATLTVAKYFNSNVDPKEVLKLVKPTINGGTERRQIVNALRQLDIDVKLRKDITINQLKWYIWQRIPVIISVWPSDWYTDHWCIVKGFSRSEHRVYLTNHDVLSVREFRKQWLDWYSNGNEKGWGLVCSRGDD